MAHLTEYPTLGNFKDNRRPCVTLDHIREFFTLATLGSVLSGGGSMVKV